MIHNLRFALYQFFFNLYAICSLALLKFWKKLHNLRLCFTDFIFYLRNLRLRFSDFNFYLHNCAPTSGFGCYSWNPKPSLRAPIMRSLFKINLCTKWGYTFKHATKDCDLITLGSMLMVIVNGISIFVGNLIDLSNLLSFKMM